MTVAILFPSGKYTTWFDDQVKLANLDQSLDQKKKSR
jgi:hypothetical protein